VKYSNVDTNCARMYGFGFAFCAVDAICAERNLLSHEPWAQNEPRALHRSKLVPGRYTSEQRLYRFKDIQRNTAILNKAGLKIHKSQPL
jgi:hypothetical protein